MSVVVLTGGVGGAKLVDGLSRALPAGALTAIVNTADDFTHLGLRICPDLDSVFYMLAGKADPVRGWGVVDESWNFMASLRDLGGEDWFNLGDRDLAMHVLRTQALVRGETLAGFTASMTGQAGIATRLLPMSEDPVATVLDTDHGTLAFQHYFVKHQCRPGVASIRFEGAEAAAVCPAVLDALADPALDAIIIAPSNPYLSVDPILSVPGMREALKGAKVPIVAVSPIVGGTAVKGPTAKMMQELGLVVGNAAIAAHYAGIIDGLLVDRSDDAAALPVATMATNTLMKDAGDRLRVAEAALELAGSL